MNLNNESLNLKERMGRHLSMKQRFVIQRQGMAIILISVFINLDYCLFYKRNLNAYKIKMQKHNFLTYSCYISLLTFNLSKG